MGFTKEDIPKYVSSAFTTKEKVDCFEFLHLHPQLESIMHIPLNAAFVVQIYKQFKYSQQSIPHTLTQLYTVLVKGLLLRYTKSVPEYRDLKILDLDNLPEPIKTQFEQLCLLAFMSFTKLNIQVTFTDSEATLYGCLDSLGLMQSSAELSIDTGTTVTHSFLHFTIQEFLAAYHLSKQPAQVQELFLQTHMKEEFHVLLKFSIGLNSSILNAYNRLIKVSSGVTTTLLHWLYESQSPEDVCRFLGNSCVHYWCSYRARALDLHALSYCLCHSNCIWSLSLNLESLTSVYHTDQPFSGKIKDLDIVQATVQGLKMFFSLPKHLLSGLQTLSIVTNTDTTSIDPLMAQVLTSGVLSNLRKFSYCSRFSTISLVLSSLLTCPNLSCIEFRSTVLTSSSIINLCQFIASHGSNSSSELSLVLRANNFVGDSLQYLISSLAWNCSQSLVHLNLSRNELQTIEVEMLSIALSTNSVLKTLILISCGFNGETVELLASGLEENSGLVELDLSLNSMIDLKGATALARMLTVNICLKRLHLQQNKLIGSEGALRLINAVESNSCLEKISLSSSCEPIEFRTILIKNIRESGRVDFL